MMDYGLQKELSDTYNEKVSLEAQVENYKSNFAKELLNGTTGQEIKESIKLGSKPIRMKKPFSMRLTESLKNFKNKLKIVFDIE